ncbi:MAG TPA: N-acetyltransferase [Rhizomicrobium sp.]|jgi:putative acetyltransferase|nr:N-acetyltransferase [Rhizomicrobium sp.]
MELRSETPADTDAIAALVAEAFPTRAEADLVDRLRTDGSAVLSLIALMDRRVIGHAMFSRMEAPTGSLGLGPVAALAGFRRRGIAAKLIREGLARAKADGWTSVFVLGDPEYYARFGFDVSLASGFRSPYAGPHLMAVPLRTGAAGERSGELRYPAAFAALD